MFATVQVRGAKDASHTLDDIARRVVHQRPIYNALRPYVLTIQKHWWETKGDGSWPDAKDSTIERDKRSNRHTDVMDATGKLKRESQRRSAVTTGQDHVLYALSSRFHGIIGLMAGSGRETIGLPSDNEVEHMAERVAEYILRGTTDA